MSTAKRLVLSLRGRKESQSTAGTSSTRLVSGNSSSPGHELDEIAVVSGSGDSSHALYGTLNQSNGPRYVPGSRRLSDNIGLHNNDDDLLNYEAIENDLPTLIPTTTASTTNINTSSEYYKLCTHQSQQQQQKQRKEQSHYQLSQYQQQHHQQQQTIKPQPRLSLNGGSLDIETSFDSSSAYKSTSALLVDNHHHHNHNNQYHNQHYQNYNQSMNSSFSKLSAPQIRNHDTDYDLKQNEYYGSTTENIVQQYKQQQQQQQQKQHEQPKYDQKQISTSQTTPTRKFNRHSVSRQSLMDIVSSKFGMPRPHFGQSISQQGFFSSSRDSISPPCAGIGGNGGSGVSGVGGGTNGGGNGGQTGTTERLPHAHVSATASEMDLSRKNRRKERGRLKGGEQPLLGTWNRTGARGSNANTLGTNTSTNHLGSGCNGTDRFSRRSGCSSTSRLRSHTKWTFVFDPAGRLCYYWSMVVSLAFLYNFWVIIYRFSFQEINAQSIVVWFCLDYFADFLYLVDILFHFRTGYLEDGVLQTDSSKLRQHYMNSTTFYIDCLCLLPLDFLYLSIGFNSILRSFRLVKIYRFWAFMDRTERHTNYPNVFRSTALIHYLIVIFHWNGCLFHLIYKNHGFGSKQWVYPDEPEDVVKQYLQSFYWCTLALTTIGDLPRPRSKSEYVFVIAQLMFGLMLFATVLGHVANIVTSVSAARKEFQAKLDGVKTYMRMRRVPNHLQVKVIKWFDYLWLTQKCSDEEKAVSCLPDKLKAEIAINVHLDTLKRVEIFQNTEAGFLCELVLRLRPVLFSPGDYICRKGEVGKEMYIVNRGRLQVVADNGKTVMASLKAGSYFGEISILNMGTAGKELGNRRTASVRSVGYSDLFVLSKKDMWDVLKEYPAARVRLEAIAVKRLEKYKKAPLEKVAMGRCQSTPGLVETKGRTPIEEMWLCQSTHTALTYYNPQSLFSRAPSPRSTKEDLTITTTTERQRLPTDTPGSLSPSSDERPRSRTMSHQSRPQSQPSRSGHHICDSLTHLSGAAVPLLGSHEALEDEIKRLRERLHTVETENGALNTKLSQQQWELENRLADIEMHLCGQSPVSSLDQENDVEDVERNRESII